MTAQPVPKSMPRPSAGDSYDQQNERRYRDNIDQELRNKHDMRGDLRVGDGMSLVLSSIGGLDYALGLTDAGRLTVTNYNTGAAGTLLVDWDEVDGAAARDIQILALESSVSGIPGIYATITALATVESDAASARATLSTNLTAAYQAADSTLQTDINTRATVTQLNAVESSLTGAIATSASSVTAAFQAADATLQTDINTRATVTQLNAAESSLTSAIAVSASSVTAAYQAADSAITASVDSIAEAYATDNAATARLVWTVDVGTNVATIAQTAATGFDDGTWNGSAILLSANEIILDADAINFGAQTEFDTASETFITEVGGVRSRYGTAFGASGNQVVMWHGPTSVAQGSEARNNGYLAIGTNGSIWYNTAALDWGATASQAAAQTSMGTAAAIAGQGWGATASEANASNAQVAYGANALTNTEFSYSSAHPPVGWANGWNGTAGVGITRDYNPTLGDIRVARAVASGAPASGTVFDNLASGAASRLPVRPGDVVGASAFVEVLGNAPLAQTNIIIVWKTQNGTYISESGSSLISNANFPLDSVSKFQRASVVATAPATAAFAELTQRAYCNGGNSPAIYMLRPMLSLLRSGTTQAPQYSPGVAYRLADPTGSNTAAAISGQGVFATGNYYEQSGDPGSVPNGSFWFKTTTNELFIRRSSAWGLVGNVFDPDDVLGAVTLSDYVVIGFTSVSSGFSQAVTATKVGGGTVTYQWVRTAESGPQRVTCSNTTAAAPTFSVATNGNSFDTWTVTVTEAASGRAYQASVNFVITSI